MAPACREQPTEALAGAVSEPWTHTTLRGSSWWWCWSLATEMAAAVSFPGSAVLRPRVSLHARLLPGSRRVSSRRMQQLLSKNAVQLSGSLPRNSLPLNSWKRPLDFLPTPKALSSPAGWKSESGRAGNVRKLLPHGPGPRTGRGEVRRGHRCAVTSCWGGDTMETRVQCHLSTNHMPAMCRVCLI